MDENETYLDKTRRHAELYGRTATDDDLAAGFLLYGPVQRVQILDDIDKGIGSGNLRKSAGELATKRRLVNLHRTLIRSGR